MTKPLFEVSVRPTRKLGIATFTGVCEGSAIIGAMDAMFGHHDWDRSFDSLWDYSGVESFDVQIAEIDAMMSRSNALTARGQRGRLAVVMDKKDYQVLARLFTVRMEKQGRQMEVLETREAAEAWLASGA